jgi:hypothetical protein
MGPNSLSEVVALSLHQAHSFLDSGACTCVQVKRGVQMHAPMATSGKSTDNL